MKVLSIRCCSLIQSEITRIIKYKTPWLAVWLYNVHESVTFCSLIGFSACMDLAQQLRRMCHGVIYLHRMNPAFPPESRKLLGFLFSTCRTFFLTPHVLLMFHPHILLSSFSALSPLCFISARYRRPFFSQQFWTLSSFSGKVEPNGVIRNVTTPVLLLLRQIKICWQQLESFKLQHIWLN